MIGQRELNFEDYLAILRRRWWVAAVPVILGPVIAYAVSLKLPTRWTSQALVLIERQRVPESFVRPVVTEDLNARLGTMQEQTLSRTRLQPMIERYGLFKDKATPEPMEELVARLQKAIELTPVKSVVTTGYGDLPGFLVAVTLENPRIAQQVCAEITSMFMEENLRQREQSSQGTADFLQSQLDGAKRRLDAQDAKLADFERRFIGSGDTQSDLNILGTLNTQLEAVTETIRRAQRDKAYTESVVAQQTAAWQALKSGDVPQRESVEQQIVAMQKELFNLETRYTQDHPDVIKLKSTIEQFKQLEKEAREAAKRGKPGQLAAPTSEPSLEDPPQIGQLRGQLHTYDETIQDNTREQQRLQQAIKYYESQVHLAPSVKQEYKQLTRDYQAALDFYNGLLKNKDLAVMATDLERKQQGEQLRLMDAASLPEKPSFPNRRKFVVAGFGGGLALGMGLALLLEMRDKSVRNERDVQQYLKLPTLAMVPSIGNTKRNVWGDRTRKRAAGAGHLLGV